MSSSFVKCTCVCFFLAAALQLSEVAAITASPARFDPLQTGFTAGVQSVHDLQQSVHDMQQPDSVVPEQQLVTAEELDADLWGGDTDHTGKCIEPPKYPREGLPKNAYPNVQCPDPKAPTTKKTDCYGRTTYKMDLETQGPGTGLYKTQPCTSDGKGECNGVNLGPLDCPAYNQPCTCKAGFQTIQRDSWKKNGMTSNKCSDPTGTMNRDPKTVECCNGHDICYSNPGSTQEKCDQEFGNCLITYACLNSLKVSAVLTALDSTSAGRHAFTISQQYALECKKSSE